LKSRRWRLASLKKRKNIELNLSHYFSSLTYFWKQKSENEKIVESDFEYMVSKGWCFKI